MQAFPPQQPVAHGYPQYPPAQGYAQQPPMPAARATAQPNLAATRAFAVVSALTFLFGSASPSWWSKGDRSIGLALMERVYGIDFMLDLIPSKWAWWAVVGLGGAGLTVVSVIALLVAAFSAKQKGAMVAIATGSLALVTAIGFVASKPFSGNWSYGSGVFFVGAMMTIAVGGMLHTRAAR